VAAALLWLARERAWLVGLVVVVLVGIGLGTAQDFSRAMMLVSPVALLGAVLAVGREASFPRWLPVAAAIAALVLPAHHVMSNRVNPIYYFYHELAALDHPPAAAMPEVFELQAVREMEQGEIARAHEHLSLAIRLAANPAGPSRHRGMLAASLGKWDEAKRDFSTVVEFDPANPEGWFLRAQAELALRDLSSARSDFEKAKSVAPADWMTRPDVGRFAAKLGQAK
jgi:tetratricopeptide (TPR) repeat protein